MLVSRTRQKLKREGRKGVGSLFAGRNSHPPSGECVFVAAELLGASVDGLAVSADVAKKIRGARLGEALGSKKVQIN